MRSKTRDLLLGFAAKSTYAKLQESILGGELEEDIRKTVKPVYPIKSVSIRKSQLLQSGVVTEKGPTLDEIHAEEARVAAEIKAKKAAALAAAMEEEAGESPSILDAAEAMDLESEEENSEEEAGPAVEAEVPEESESVEVDEVSESDSQDFDNMTVAELKELLKAAGKPVSGKKAELIARLQE
tara:strand:- start:1316 stop:1867 length:552 start_codon:yes stop_codon:yes gene_type:complete